MRRAESLWRALLSPPSRGGRGVLHRVGRGALSTAALLYGAGVRVRNVLYDRGVFRSSRLSAPTVSVGNITLGGSGKTPFVELLARRLQAVPLRVAVLSRGYGGQGRTVTVIADGRTSLPWSADRGEEAVLLAEKLPGAIVVTGVDRVRAGEEAERLGAQVCVLDDGFQHRRLARGWDIVLMDSRTVERGGHLFPRGFLREPPSSLKRATLLVLLRGEAAPSRAALEEVIRRYTPRAPVVVVRKKARDLWIPSRGESRSATSLQGRSVVAFSGIAQPSSFEETLRQCQAELLVHRVFPDHWLYRARDLAPIFEEAESLTADAVLTTEKDWIKIRGQGPVPPTVAVLRMTLEIDEGDKEIDTLVEAVAEQAATRGER